MLKIEIRNHNVTMSATPSLSLLNNFLLNNAPIHTVCGGKGLCGCCRVRILAGGKGVSKVTATERQHLGEQLIAEGWRLSCQTHILRDVTVHMPTAQELAAWCG